MALREKVSKGIKQLIRRKTPFVEDMYKAWNGERILCQIRELYGKDTHIFLMRGATGDTYIQLAMIDCYRKKKNISSYKIVADSAGCRDLAKLFREKNLIEMNGYKVDSIEKAYMLLGSKKLNVTILFPWTYSLYFNRCRIRMTERFHFMDTYQYYVFHLHEKAQLRIPVFQPLTTDKTTELIRKGFVRGKTVYMAPDANSVTRLDSEIWNQMIEGLIQKGYAVIVNAEQAEGYHAPNYFCTYAESVPILEYAGFFIGLRSGFCDIISSARCRKIIIYPAKRAVVNYSEHRTEIEFCGLKRMHLVEEADETLTEIDTLLVRNITDPGVEIQSEREQEHEKMLLIQKVLDCFPEI